MRLRGAEASKHRIVAEHDPERIELDEERGMLVHHDTHRHAIVVTALVLSWPLVAAAQETPPPSAAKKTKPPTTREAAASMPAAAHAGGSRTAPSRLLAPAGALRRGRGVTREAPVVDSPHPGVADSASAAMKYETVVVGKPPRRGETLDVHKIRESSALDIGEALEAQGLTYKVRKGSIANDVVLRAFQRDNISVSIDGALLHGACPNRMDPAAFHIDYTEVDRVEVMKGPFDVRSPGSMGGIVNIETRTPQPGPVAEVNSLYGSFNRYEVSGVAGYEFQRGGALGSFAFKTAQPYRVGNGALVTNIYPTASANRYRDGGQHASAYNITTGWAQGGVSFLARERDRLQVSYAFQGAKNVAYPYLLMDAVYDDTHRLNATYTVKNVGPASRVLARFYWNRISHVMNDAHRCSSAAETATCTGALLQPWSMETDATASMTGGKLEATFGRQKSWTVGVDVYSRLWNATTTRRMAGNYTPQAFIPQTNVVDLGGYATWTHRFSRPWRLTAEARLDVARSHARLSMLPAAQATTARGLYVDLYGPDLPMSTTDILGAGNVQLEWRPTDLAKLYLGVGTGTRVPDPQERYMALTGAMNKPGRVGNPRLGAPQNTEVDLGVTLAGTKLLFKAQVFGAVVNDHIVLAPATAASGAKATTYQNVVAGLAGTEARLHWKLPWHFSVGATLSYTYGQQIRPSMPLQEMPPLAGTASVRWDNDLVFVQVDAPWAARQTRVSEAVQEPSTDPWIIANLRAGVSWRGLKAFAGITNIFDRYYFQYFNYLRDPFASGVQVPEPGRTVYVAMDYRY